MASEARTPYLAVLSWPSSSTPLSKDSTSGLPYFSMEMPQSSSACSVLLPQLLCLKRHLWCHLACHYCLPYLQFPLWCHFPWNPPLLFFSPELINTLLFKIKPSGNPNGLQVPYVFWNKAELWAIVKEFPKVTEDTYKFAKEFDIIIQAYQPVFSDLYQLICILIGESQMGTPPKKT